MSNSVFMFTVFTIQDVKKIAQALRVYSAPLNEQKLPRQHMPRNQCLLRKEFSV
jgi:hypothetical protein